MLFNGATLSNREMLAKIKEGYSMTVKEELKTLVDQLPETKAKLVATWVRSVLQERRHKPPKGRLGLKRPFDREELYDDVLADRL